MKSLQALIEMIGVKDYNVLKNEFVKRKISRGHTNNLFNYI